MFAFIDISHIFVRIYLFQWGGGGRERNSSSSSFWITFSACHWLFLLQSRVLSVGKRKNSQSEAENVDQNEEEEEKYTENTQISNFSIAIAHLDDLWCSDVLKSTNLFGIDK